MSHFCGNDNLTAPYDDLYGSGQVASMLFPTDEVINATRAKFGLNASTPLSSDYAAGVANYLVSYSNALDSIWTNYSGLEQPALLSVSQTWGNEKAVIRRSSGRHSTTSATYQFSGCLYTLKNTFVKASYVDIPMYWTLLPMNVFVATNGTLPGCWFDSCLLEPDYNMTASKLNETQAIAACAIKTLEEEGSSSSTSSGGSASANSGSSSVATNGSASAKPNAGSSVSAPMLTFSPLSTPTSTTRRCSRRPWPTPLPRRHPGQAPNSSASAWSSAPSNTSASANASANSTIIVENLPAPYILRYLVENVYVVANAGGSTNSSTNAYQNASTSPLANANVSAVGYGAEAPGSAGGGAFASGFDS